MSDSLQPHGIGHCILQARILEWVAIPFSKVSSQPRDRTQVSHSAGRFFTSWATRETHQALTWPCTIHGKSPQTFPWWSQCCAGMALGALMIARCTSAIQELWKKQACFFNWGIVGLQYYINFCWAAKWLLYIYIHIHIHFYILSVWFIIAIEYSSLWYTAGPSYLSILYIKVFIC